MAFLVTVQDPDNGRRKTLTVEGATTAQAIMAAGRAAPGMRVLDVRRADQPVEIEELEAIEDDAPVFARPDMEGAAASEAHIEWRPARRPMLPLVGACAVGIVIGGIGTMALTGEAERLLGTSAPAATGATDEGPALDAVHGAPEAVVAAETSDGALPAETQRITGPDAESGGSVYRVITRDEATGYLYETLIRATTAEEAAERCASRTRMRIVEVQWIGAGR